MDIETRKQNGILTIEFNRPDKKNSITAAMYRMMADAIKTAKKTGPCASCFFAANRRFSRRATIWKIS